MSLIFGIGYILFHLRYKPEILLLIYFWNLYVRIYIFRINGVRKDFVKLKIKTTTSKCDENGLKDMCRVTVRIFLIKFCEQWLVAQFFQHCYPGTLILTHISKGWVLSYTHNNACHFAQWPSNEHFQIKFLEIFSNFRLFSVTSLYTMPDVRFCPSCLICCWITRSPAASKFSSFSMTWTSSFWLWLKVVAMVMRRCLLPGFELGAE